MARKIALTGLASEPAIFNGGLGALEVRLLRR
jgi:hypothetical protein